MQPILSAASVLSLFCWCLAGPMASAEAPVDDPDFAIQGEYSGPNHSMHVIARGEGEFDIVVFNSPIEKRSPSDDPPRRLEGDEDTVADLVDALEVQRIERTSPTLGAQPPSDAIVLFDGTEKSLANWRDGVITSEGWLKQGTQTGRVFRDYSLHLEFRTPWMPSASGQARGNSGVYHQGRYETQILDSFGLSGAQNETGGIYGVKTPDSNACLPPMQWQTYDVDFTAARFQSGKKVADARLTVRLNGVAVQSDVAVPKATTAAPLNEGAEDGPIYLQDHGNEVRYRNIWLVPRDAVREAARPIVPGFERLFANTVDEDGLGGELLISTLGCTSCHEGSESVLPAKQGPDLSGVAARLRPDALVAMIADPHQTKRGTTMPDPWMGLNADQRDNAAKSIASFLMLGGNQETLIDRPARPSAVRRGRSLYHSVGCLACHQSFDENQLPAATTVPIGDVATKYTVDSLAKLVANPHAIRGGGRMPSLVGSMGDAYAIASFLTRKVTERKSETRFRRRIYKGKWKTMPDFDSLTPASEDTVDRLQDDKRRNEKYIAMVFDSQIRVSAAGEYRFTLKSDDGSRLTVGPHEILNDGIHPPTTVAKSVELAPGTYPVRVEWFNYEGGGELEVRVEDPLLGDVPLRDVISDGNETVEPLLASRFEARPEWVESGKSLFQKSGCASCHSFKSGEGSVEASGTAAAPALSDVQSGRGCLARSVSRPAVDFHLSAKQRSSINHAIELRRQKRSVVDSITDEQIVHLTMAGLNCYACHPRAGVGGPEPSRDPAFTTTTIEMGWESRLPPPLDGAADKLQSDYLLATIADGANERPYMHTRMPGFGKDNVRQLHQALVRADRDGDAESSIADPSPDVIPDGRKLVGASGLSCVKCHSYNGMTGGGLGVIDLLAMPQRLRADWFARYLQHPTKYRPGTRMPNSFAEGRSTYTKLYDGDPAKQISAMWAYLKAGDSVKEPPGVRGGSILLTPTERPRIYRNFFEGVSGRGIAVGYPDEVNLIWDAERMALATIWKHEFVDAARHWSGRGQGRIGPAGDQVRSFEDWTPIVTGETIDQTWPEESGRELGYRFGGYRLDPSGNPAFEYSINGIAISDRVVPISNSVVERQLTIDPGKATSQGGLVWRIARSESIETSADGFRVGQLVIRVDGVEGRVVSVGDRQELRAMIPTDRPVTVTQRIEW